MADTVEQVKQALDIVDYISRFVPLKKAGKNFVGLCPFHNEKTPSFVVSPEMQIYKCFGCGASGDIIKFVQEFEGLEFKEALEKLAKEAGISVEFKKESAQAKLFLQILELANKYFEQQLFKKENSKAFNYLSNNRKFDEKTIKAFHIGFAPPNSQLIDYLQKKFKEQDLVNSGIAIKTKNGLINRFRGRITFPLIDTRDRIIGFTGRKLKEADFGPKYMHSPENVLFKKRFFLFGLNKARKAIHDENLCIFCEGPTDVISAWQHGIQNFVAPLGTGITETQIQLAARYSKNLLFFMDSDEAGQKSLERILQLTITNTDLTCYAATPKPFKDVDELLKTKPQKINEIIEQKKDLFSVVLANKLSKTDISDAQGYKEIITFIRNIIKQNPDPAQKDFLLSRAANLTGIPKEEIANNSTQRKRTSTKTANKSTTKPLEKEKYFLALLFILKPSGKQLDMINPLAFFNKDIRETITDLKSLSSINYTNVGKRLKKEKPELTKELSLLKSHIETNNLYTEKDFLVLYNQIKAATYKKWLHLIRKNLAIAETLGDENRIEELTAKIDKLTRELYE